VTAPDETPSFFSRERVLGGSPARRATTLLLAIEGRTARRAERARQAMATYLTPHVEEEKEREFLAALADARRPIRISAQDLERHAPAWAALLPADPESVAAVAALIGQKYDFRRGDARGISRALRLEEPAVAAAFERQRGEPIASIFAPSLPLAEQARWARARATRALESLPPFWTAFALTLSETVGASVLALPIAFAIAGPAAAVAMLVVLGVINVLTLAGLVEAITRTGKMRYGSSYFGRLVGEYLGRSGRPRCRSRCWPATPSRWW
jgi:hypothetical protein